MRKKTVGLLCYLVPRQMVKLAYRQLTNPQIKKLRQNEIDVLDTSEKKIYNFLDFKIQTYTWQGGDKKILLIHGWEGQAGNFSDIIKSLVQEGYTVYAFDGPSHGYSSKGETSLMEFNQLVGELIRHLGVSYLLSHSFGGVATTYALSVNTDLEIERYVLITTPDKFSDRINFVCEQVGLTQGVQSKLEKRLQEELGIDVNTLNVSNFVKKANVKKALIIHDKNDKVLPISQSKNVNDNWPASELVVVEGTGHFRILRTENVINKLIYFLNA